VVLSLCHCGLWGMAWRCLGRLGVPSWAFGAQGKMATLDGARPEIKHQSWVRGGWFVQISGMHVNNINIRVSPHILAECGTPAKPSYLLSLYPRFISDTKTKTKTKTSITHIVLVIMPGSENKARALRGELYHAFTPELVAERRRCARACTTYNNADTTTRRQQVELWKE
jgi:hypothetical protein